MTATKNYAGYITILAAISFVSCGTAPVASQGSDAAASEIEIPASTVLWVELQKDLDSAKLKIGDRFSGSIAEDVLVDAKPIIPKATGVKGRVTNTGKDLSLVLDSLTVRGSGYNVTTNPVTLEAAQPTSSAYMPKKGILQFYLASAVRIKSPR